MLGHLRVWLQCAVLCIKSITGGGGGNKFLLHHARWDFPGSQKGPPAPDAASAIKQKADTQQQRK